MENLTINFKITCIVLTISCEEKFCFYRRCSLQLYTNIMHYKIRNVRNIEMYGNNFIFPEESVEEYL